MHRPVKSTTDSVSSFGTKGSEVILRSCRLCIMCSHFPDFKKIGSLKKKCVNEVSVWNKAACDFRVRWNFGVGLAIVVISKFWTQLF